MISSSKNGVTGNSVTSGVFLNLRTYHNHWKQPLLPQPTFTHHTTVIQMPAPARSCLDCISTVRAVSMPLHCINSLKEDGNCSYSIVYISVSFCTCVKWKVTVCPATAWNKSKQMLMMLYPIPSKTFQLVCIINALINGNVFVFNVLWNHLNSRRSSVHTAESVMQYTRFISIGRGGGGGGVKKVYSYQWEACPSRDSKGDGWSA